MRFNSVTRHRIFSLQFAKAVVTWPQLPKSDMRTPVKIFVGLTLLILLALIATHQRPTGVTAKKAKGRNTVANADSLATLKGFHYSPEKSAIDAQSGLPKSEVISTDGNTVPALPEPSIA